MATKTVTPPVVASQSTQKAGNAAPAVAQQPATSTPRKKRTSNVPENETTQQAFARLGVARVTTALDKIRLIGNLGNYKPTDEQVAKIVDRLNKAVSEMATRLKGTAKTEENFTL